ncbi:hypothetical protein, partial [Thalassovita litoralis]|uniref:hypothetical protein n=1 Tax=Thalassovita litoralis TaxID=1010611 RepID=UPI001C8F85C9
ASPSVRPTVKRLSAAGEGGSKHNSHYPQAVFSRFSIFFENSLFVLKINTLRIFTSRYLRDTASAMLQNSIKRASTLSYPQTYPQDVAQITGIHRDSPR